MSDQSPRSGAPAGFPKGLRLALLAALAVGAVVLLIAIGSTLFHPGPEYVAGKGPAGSSVSTAAPAAAGAKTSLPEPSAKGVGEPAPATAFKDGDGKAVTLADFKGKVVVANLWATWCGPCVKEMPTLAALQALSAGKGVRVVAISQDAARTTDKAKAFIAGHKPLDFYQDAGTELTFALKPPVLGFPTTVIFDKTGRERMRVSGDLDWSSARVRRMLDALAAE